RLFPEAITLRKDKDTTGKKGAYSSILSDFLNKKADILIGTQMIVKGHDFENVTLVGIMLADLSLFDNDYRAGEKTFDLLTQAAGRAGRGEKRGHVVIQTYQPEHYAICAATKQSYEEFFDMEMTYRRLLKYPPVYNMMVVLITGDNYDELCVASKELHSSISDRARSLGKIRIIGPSDATILKINDVYRRVIYLKSTNSDELMEIRNTIDEFSRDGIKIGVDVNPVNMY
ncbi:MAG: primosomal protein N', partial [Lachnospiraceae bacterium]|nr:primosomal protein N' [Lachnospiraceae bacterium]